MPSTDEKTQRLLDLFVQAWEAADVSGLVALLKADATLAMPPSPSWYQGQNAIGTFVAATVFADGGMFPGQAADRWRLLATRSSTEGGRFMCSLGPGAFNSAQSKWSSSFRTFPAASKRAF